MSPRSGHSTTSSSFYSEDVPLSIDLISMDDPTNMSPTAIQAELQSYGVASIPSLGDRQQLEAALIYARKNSGGSGRGGSGGGLGSHQQQQYQQKQQFSRSTKGESASPTYDHIETTAARVPGMKVAAQQQQQYHHQHSQSRSFNNRGTSANSGGKNSLRNIKPTHIPLTPQNRIPPQILNIIRTSADRTMRAINLDHRSLGDREIIKLSDALRHNTTIEYLSVTHCLVTDVGIQKLCDMLSHNKTLVELHLDSNQITTEGAAALSTALIRNDTLAVLTLNDNGQIGDGGIVYLIGALEHNLTLRTLEVHDCGVNDTHSTKSKEGSYSRNSSRGSSGSGNSNKKKKKINRLEQIEAILADRQIDANFESLLERLLDDDFRVTGIDLSGRKIGDAGLIRLAEALADNTQVRQLWLRGCNINNEGAKSLASCLEQNMAIVDLFLGNNSIGDEGLVAISDALAISNATLVSLEMDDNMVGERGLESFYQALDKNTSVLVASFEGNDNSNSNNRKLLDTLQTRLADKRNGLNLISFVVDPDAESVTGGGDGNNSGIINMSVCSSYMPSTYRRAGFTSVAGTQDISSRAHESKSTGSHQFSIYNRANSNGAGAAAAAQQQQSSRSPFRPPVPPPPPPKPSQQHHQEQRLQQGPIEPEYDTQGGVEPEGLQILGGNDSFLASEERLGPTIILRRASTSSRNKSFITDASNVSPITEHSEYTPMTDHSSARTPLTETSSRHQHRHNNLGSSRESGMSGGIGSTRSGVSGTSSRRQQQQQLLLPEPQQQARPVVQQQPQRSAAPPKHRPTSPPGASYNSRTKVYQQAQVPVPLKARALEPIAERDSVSTSSKNSPTGVMEVRAATPPRQPSPRPPTPNQELVKKEQQEETLIQKKKNKNDGATTLMTEEGDSTLMAKSLASAETQQNFNATLKKLWRRVEMMKRTNHFAAAHYKARHFWWWFVPISTNIGLSILLSLATAVDVSGSSTRIILALCSMVFALMAFALNFLQTRFGWSSRSEVHRSAEVELSQVAFRLDTLGKYEGHGLTTGSHSTRARANAIRDLYRIDVYLQAMQRCTPAVPDKINEIFYLLASRLKGICIKCPNVVKMRWHEYDDEDVTDDNPVPVDMQIDALDLLGQEIECYFLYPLFMPNARDVVSRTIDIFFSPPFDDRGGGGGYRDHRDYDDGGGDTQSYYSEYTQSYYSEYDDEEYYGEEGTYNSQEEYTIYEEDDSASQFT